MAGIHSAITAAMKDIEPIAKSKRNQAQGFAYRGIDDIMNELNPILARHGIFVYPVALENTREERTTKSGGNMIYSVMRIEYHFTASDGSEICVVVIGEGMDSGDKASNKALASGLKYALMQVFCIPTADIKDPDDDSHLPSTKKEPDTKPKDDKKPKDGKKQDADKKPYDPFVAAAHIRNKYGVKEQDIAVFIGNPVSEMTREQALNVMASMETRGALCIPYRGEKQNGMD